MLKTIITRKLDDVITNIVDTSVEVENGLKVTDSTGEYIIAFINECNQYENVETSDTVMVGKYKYTVADGFVLNADYVEYKTPEQELTDLKSQMTEMQIAINMALGL